MKNMLMVYCFVLCQFRKDINEGNDFLLEYGKVEFRERKVIS